MEDIMYIIVAWWVERLELFLKLQGGGCHIKIIDQDKQMPKIYTNMFPVSCYNSTMCECTNILKTSELSAYKNCN